MVFNRYAKRLLSLTAAEYMKLETGRFFARFNDEEPGELEDAFIARTDIEADEPLLTRKVAQGKRITSDMVRLKQEITYAFSKNHRNSVFPSFNLRTGKMENKNYGSDRMTNRLLYELLCQAYNGGAYFIDTYLNENFPSSSAYEAYTRLHERVQKIAVEALNELDDEIIRTGAYVSQKQMLAWVRAYSKGNIMQELNDVAARIRDDIIMCLSTGQIRLNMEAVSASTIRQRKALGLDGDASHVFYASGRLISALNIYISFDDSALEAA